MKRKEKILSYLVVKQYLYQHRELFSWHITYLDDLCKCSIFFLPTHVCIFILHVLSTRKNEIWIWTLVLAAEFLAVSMGTTDSVTRQGLNI